MKKTARSPQHESVPLGRKRLQFPKPGRRKLSRGTIPNCVPLLANGAAAEQILRIVDEIEEYDELLGGWAAHRRGSNGRGV